MSKFCGNCGTVMDDAAAVCGNCGAPLAPAAAPAQKKAAKIDVNAIKGQVTGVIDGVKKGDKNAMIKGGIGVAAVVVVLILIISLFSGGGEDKVVKKFIKAYDKENAAALVKLMPKYTIEAGEEADDDYDPEELWEGRIESFYEYMEEELDADGLKLSYKIKDKDEVDEDDLEDYADMVKAGLKMMDSDVEFKKDKVKKGYEIEVEVTVKGGGDKDKVDLDLYLIKYGSKWYLVDYAWDY